MKFVRVVLFIIFVSEPIFTYCWHCPEIWNKQFVAQEPFEANTLCHYANANTPFAYCIYDQHGQLAQAVREHLVQCPHNTGIDPHGFILAPRWDHALSSLIWTDEQTELKHIIGTSTYFTSCNYNQDGSFSAGFTECPEQAPE